MIGYEIDRDYEGLGVSKGLHRGLLVSRDGVPLAEEGMGIGACAYRSGGLTYFASIVEVKKNDGNFIVHLAFDRILRQRYFGHESKWIDNARAFLVENIYMKHEAIQAPMLRLCRFVRKFFRIDETVEGTESAGEAFIIYEPQRNEVLIKMKFRLLKPDGILYIMNELGGHIFDRCLADGMTALEPPSGWQKLKGNPELYSSSHGIAFSISEPNPGLVESRRFFWGREVVKGICAWSGFEIELRPNTNATMEYAYRVHFREVI